MQRKINLYKSGEICGDKFRESLDGWLAYAKWANSYKLINKLFEYHSKINKD